MPRNIEIANYNHSHENLVDSPAVLVPISVDLFYSHNPDAENRRSLHTKTTSLFNQISDVNLDFDSALIQKKINPDQLSDFYNHLSEFIQSDPNHSRIILYLPFQTLPNLNHPSSQSDKLIQSQQKFIQTYKNAWVQLLFESDTRADFVDGDFLEPGLGKPVLVRKAAHLIPELLHRGILQEDFIEEISLLNYQDKELINSIQEGLSTSHSLDSFEDTAVFCLDELKKSLLQVGQKFSLKSGLISHQSIKDKYQSASIPDTKISPERAAWLHRTQRDEIFNKTARHISDSKTINLLFDLDSPSTDYKIIGLKAIFNQESITDHYDSLIKKFWQSNDNQIKNTIITGLSRWQKRGIVNQDYLNQFGLTTPDFSSPFPIDLNKLVSSDFNNLNKAIDQIKNNPELSKSIYPVFLVFGSRVKGYSNFGSDYDAAIFFKPEADFEKREFLLEQIRNIPELKNICKLSEIWTNFKDGQISFRSINSKVWTMVEPNQIHFLFNGVWIGDSLDSQKLRRDFQSKYLDLSRFDSQKNQARSFLLRQLESDILQCRLLHKGYHLFYPDQKPVGISKLNLIDGNSAFWDPGYRRVATQLFLSRVFLPDLSK